MSSGTIYLKHRPLRIACDTKPTNTQEVESAIQINSFLWGGSFNLMVPDISRMPVSWVDSITGKYTAKKMRQAYIDIFDPDIMISNKQATARYDGNVMRESVTKDDFWEYSEREHCPAIGIGIYDIANHLYHSELKYLQRNPYTFKFPKWEPEYSLFFSALFGMLPIKQFDHFVKYFGEALGIEFINCTISNFFDFFEPHNLFLRRISQFGIKVNGLNRNIDLVYLLDAKNAVDIFDYWNLRALGATVIPIPIQALAEPKVFAFIVKFIEDSYYSYKNDPQIYHNATIQKSRSISKGKFKEFGSILSEYIKNEKDSYPKYIFREWFPRIWEIKGTTYDEKLFAVAEHSEQRMSLTGIPDKLTFTPPKLEFMEKFSVGHPLYATDIDYRLYSSNSLYAEVFPNVNRALATDLGAHEVCDWRFSKGGLVHLCRHADWQVELDWPLSEHVFRKWLTGKGWKAELSVPGKVAQQMIKQLGGLWDVGLLMNEQTIKMLSEMCEDRYKLSEDVRAVAARRVNQQRFGRSTPEGIIERLVKSSALALGIEAQCTTCNQHSWFSLTEFDYKLRCPKCLSEFNPPFSKPTDMHWAYKAIGPFNLPKQSYGVYVVLLVARFFCLSFDLSTTPMLSFNAKKGDAELESDLALLFRPQKFDAKRMEPSVLFAECKSYNQFTKKDVDRMRQIADNFPEAYIVFATLRNNLDQNEIHLIKGLANRGRKIGTDYRPKNPVIILTGEQLFDSWWPPHSWEKKEEPFASISKKYNKNDMDGLFDVTQQLFLGIEPWSEYFNNHMERIKSTKKRMSKHM